MQQRVPVPDRQDDEALLTLRVTLDGGGRFEAPAAAGFHIMELIRAHGLPIKAECGGACVCSTCHVRVPAPWRDLLPSASDEELGKLDEIPTADEFSRLACQLTMTAALDGIEVDVQGDSLVQKTHPVAG
jgi:ferredoxin, 2Fe-2S